MPSGVSARYYPAQPPPPHPLERDNSYFLVRIHDAQVFFSATWPQRAGFVLVSAAVTSSAYPDQPVKSLYKVDLIARNTPVRLGLSPNLTDWLPAQADASLRIALTYSVVQAAPFKTLLDKMGDTHLAAKVSLIRPEWVPHQGIQAFWCFPSHLSGAQARITAPHASNVPLVRAKTGS